MFGNIDGFIEDDPDGGFPATRVRGGALISQVLLGVGEQRTQRKVLDGEGTACGDGVGLKVKDYWCFLEVIMIILQFWT